MQASVFVLLFTLGVVFAGVLENPLSDEFINKINKLGSTWKAGRNFDINTPPSHIKGLLGALKENRNLLPEKRIEVEVSFPENFDARDKWPQCESLKVVRDQSTCGSDWALAAVEAMSDRICIHSDGKKQVSISANDLLTCCGWCGGGCSGAYPANAWAYWVEYGIVSGGLYGETEGCQSYVFPPCEHHTTGSLEPCGPIKPTPECTRKCDNSTVNYRDELYYGGSAYYLPVDEYKITYEIFYYGPVEASFDVYEDFLQYKSGVYHHVIGSYLGRHSVKVIGWGVENNLRYWLAANSWNEDWGDQGYFKIVRGTNECHFENAMVAGLPQ